MIPTVGRDFNVLLRYKQESTTKSEAIIALKTRLSDSIDLLQKTSSTNLINNPKLVKSILKYPVQSISDVLQLQDTFIVVTSAQAPFFIEVSNIYPGSFYFPFTDE